MDQSPTVKQPTQPAYRSLANLTDVGWMSEQPVEFQDRMARLGRWISVSRGSMIYAVGDEADAIFGLGEGMLDVAIPISEDQEVIAHRALPGFWIGDSALLAKSLRTVSVYAAADSRLFKLPAAAVHRSLQEFPEDWMCFYRLSHSNVSLGLRALAEVISLPPRARFARALLRLTSTDGMVRLTQEELGRMVGMSRAAFRRAFSALIKQGIVEVEYGGICIKNRLALEQEAARIES
ncbi:Crp/Fnr family transcriptional regulator [Albidovulum sp.]|uniref:Crp/Fnr family transcriptional regulator n=1 Tax=Albidovulum sp. TaxID=1872424 RepID=UPI0039B8C27D